MASTTGWSDTDQLPVFPGMRAEGCPFGLPAESVEWRESKGLIPRGGKPQFSSA